MRPPLGGSQSAELDAFACLDGVDGEEAELFGVVREIELDLYDVVAILVDAVCAVKVAVRAGLGGHQHVIVDGVLVEHIAVVKALDPFGGVEDDLAVDGYVGDVQQGGGGVARAGVCRGERLGLRVDGHGQRNAQDAAVFRLVDGALIVARLILIVDAGGVEHGEQQLEIVGRCGALRQLNLLIAAPGALVHLLQPAVVDVQRRALFAAVVKRAAVAQAKAVDEGVAAVRMIGEPILDRLFKRLVVGEGSGFGELLVRERHFPFVKAGGLARTVGGLHGVGGQRVAVIELVAIAVGLVKRQREGAIRLVRDELFVIRFGRTGGLRCLGRVDLCGFVHIHGVLLKAVKPVDRPVVFRIQAELAEAAKPCGQGNTA